MPPRSFDEIFIDCTNVQKFGLLYKANKEYPPYMCLPNELIVEILDFVDSFELPNKVKDRFGKRREESVFFRRHIQLKSKSCSIEQQVRLFAHERPCIVKVDSNYQQNVNTEYFRKVRSLKPNFTLLIIGNISRKNSNEYTNVLVRKQPNKRQFEIVEEHELPRIIIYARNWNLMRYPGGFVM